MEDGKETGVRFELTEKEKILLVFQHGAHIKCELGKCIIHTMVHMIIRLEAARRKMDHDWEHSEVGICERCQWTPGQWIESLGNEWGRDG